MARQAGKAFSKTITSKHYREPRLVPPGRVNQDPCKGMFFGSFDVRMKIHQEKPTVKQGFLFSLERANSLLLEMNHLSRKWMFRWPKMTMERNYG